MKQEDPQLYSIIPLVPEGNPMVNKTDLPGEAYRTYLDNLKTMGVSYGVLVQATNATCSVNAGFRDYIRATLTAIAFCHSDHTRELVYGESVHPVNLGTRPTFADIGATVADYLGVAYSGAGESLWPRIRKERG